MNQKNNTANRHFGRRESERGNVLFLILIAVALFAALSFAVSFTSREQPNNKSDGDSIAAAELNQYPSTIRVALTRMTIGGIKVQDLEFNRPEAFDTLTSPEVGVFHPQGGRTAYADSAPTVMASGTAGDWHINLEFEIDGISSSAASSLSGNDLIAFLPGVRRAVCEQINERVGVPGIPNTSGDLSGRYMLHMNDSYVVPSDEAMLGPAAGNGTNDLYGKPAACFQNNGGEYVFYEVLLEL